MTNPNDKQTPAEAEQHSRHLRTIIAHELSHPKQNSFEMNAELDQLQREIESLQAQQTEADIREDSRQVWMTIIGFLLLTALAMCAVFYLIAHTGEQL